MSEYVILKYFIIQMNMNSGLFINLQHNLIEQGLSVLYFLYCIVYFMYVYGYINSTKL